MGNISDYTRVLASKLADVFVVDQTDNGTTETKSATVEQIGTAIGTLQNFADLDTSNKTLVDAINEIASYTPVYGNTASGAIATFDTSLSLPLQDCTIEINGTDLSGANIYTRGSNLWDEVWELGDLSATTGEKTNDNTRFRSKNYIPVTPNTTIYCYTANYTGRKRIAFYDSNKTYLGQETGFDVMPNGTYTTPSNAFYALFYIEGTTYGNDVSINFPATDTAYHAYNANSNITAISWNDLGTVSEGSLDLTTGKLTVVNGSMGAGVYQLIPTPITTIVGTNNVFTDTNGNTSVVYACSLKDYIDSQ